MIGSLASCASRCTVQGHKQGDKGEDNHHVDKSLALVWASVEVFLVLRAKLLSAVENESDRDQEQDEWSTNTASVRDHDLWVTDKHYNDDDWDSEDDRPESLDTSLMILHQTDTE